MRTDRADIGFIGAGQLARMSAAPAIALDLRLAVLANHPNDSAAQVIPDVAIGNPDSMDEVLAFAEHCDVLTFDHELVDTELLDRLEAEGFIMRPSSAVLRLSQSKRLQRKRFAALELPQPVFLVADDRGAVQDFVKHVGFPLVVKSDRGGYDGRGVWKLAEQAELDALLDELEIRSIVPILEEPVPLERELAIQIARTPSGEMRTYPLVETVQVGGMLRELIAPAPDSEELQNEARRIVEAIAVDSGVVGLLAVELFQANGRLLVNEIATRPHNSGHYSIEGAVTSQFEQHLRAVLELPLGSTALVAPWAVTINIIGDPTCALSRAQIERAMAIEGVHLHIYGKEARPGRKIGHLTVLGDDWEETRTRAHAAAVFLNGELEDDQER